MYCGSLRVTCWRWHILAVKYRINCAVIVNLFCQFSVLLQSLAIIILWRKNRILCSCGDSQQLWNVLCTFLTIIYWAFCGYLCVCVGLADFTGPVERVWYSVAIHCRRKRYRVMSVNVSCCWFVFFLTEEEHEKINEIHHWKNERYVAIALLPIIPAALAFPHPVLDTALVTAMCLHTHW